jgi:YD repeat-containing protein
VGRVTSIQTPHVLTTHGINPNGTIAWTEVTGRRTTFEYDLAFRPTVIRPPDNTQVVTYEYDNQAAGFVIQRRLPSA